MVRGKNMKFRDKNINESMSDGVVLDDEIAGVGDGLTVECCWWRLVSMATKIVW